MSKHTDYLEAIAEEIRTSGCVEGDDQWTGRAAVRIVLDDATEDGEEYLYLEFTDEDNDCVWLPEDCLAKAPMLTSRDMELYFNHVR